MKYWKHLDIPEFEELQNDLRVWFSTQTYGQTGERWNEVNLLNLLLGVPRLGKALRHLNVRATYAVAIILRETDKPIIHIDAVNGIQARILFPVLNTEGSYTAFYEAKKPGVLVTDYDTNKPSIQFQPEDVVEVTRLELSKPAIIRVNEPHCVICGENYPRITLSLAFNKDPIWMLNDK